MTLNGTSSWPSTCDGPGCGVGACCGGGSDTISGTCSYNPSTCVLTVGGLQTAHDCTIPYGGPQCGVSDYTGNPGFSITLTPTVQTGNRDGLCHLFSDNHYRQISGNQTATLSSENTPAMVLASATPVAGTDNCAWGTIIDATGEGCPSGAFTVSEQTCDWTISFTGLVIGCTYKVVITFVSTPGDMTTEIHLFTADATTDMLTGSIIQTEGVTTCLTDYVVTAGDQ